MWHGYFFASNKMEIFWTLLLKTTPLYINIILGFIAGRILKVQGDNIAKLMFYIFIPIVVFHGIATTHLDAKLLLLPLIVFLLCCTFCFTFLKIGKHIFDEGSSLPNILALSVATVNSGYFGLPIALILFDSNTVGIYITAFVGMTLFENSLGFYISAKGKYTASESFLKVIKLPTLYAFILGLIFSFNNIDFHPIMEEYAQNIRSGYVVLGMMLIGFGIAKIGSCPMDYRFFNLAFSAKFLLWPLVIFLLVSLDKHLLGIFNESAHKALTLLSILPMAANSVAIATVLDAHPSRVATTVLASTLFAMLYVPLMVALLSI